MAFHSLQGRVTVGRGTWEAGQGTSHLAKDQRIRWPAKFHQLPKNTSRLTNKVPQLTLLPSLMDTGSKSTGVASSCYCCSQRRGVLATHQYQETKSAAFETNQTCQKLWNLLQVFDLLNPYNFLARVLHQERSPWLRDHVTYAKQGP